MSVLKAISEYLCESFGTDVLYEFKMGIDAYTLVITKNGVATDSVVKFWWKNSKAPDGQFWPIGQALTAENDGVGICVALIDDGYGEKNPAKGFIEGRMNGVWGINAAKLYVVGDEEEFLDIPKDKTDPEPDVDELESDAEAEEILDAAEAVVDDAKDGDITQGTIEDLGDKISDVKGSDADETEDDEVKTESTSIFGSLLTDRTIADKRTADIMVESYQIKAKKMKRKGALVQNRDNGVTIILESTTHELSNKTVSDIMELCPVGVTRNDFLISVASEW
jgi:hypothetical protein